MGQTENMKRELAKAAKILSGFCELSTDSRPGWHEYFSRIAKLVSSRSTCMRRSVGAVIVKDQDILATGYNGNPSGLAHCVEIGCLRTKLKVPSGTKHELCTGLHAEQNAIIQAAKHGTSIAGATLYCTTKPCSICAKMIIQAGIEKVVYSDMYPDELADQYFENAGVIMIYLPIEEDTEHVDNLD